MAIIEKDEEPKILVLGTLSGGYAGADATGKFTLNIQRTLTFSP